MVPYFEVSLAGIAIILSVLSWKTLRKIKHLDLGKSFWIPVMLSGIFFFTGAVTQTLNDLGYSFAYSFELASISRLFALCILLVGVYAYSRQISKNLAGKFIDLTSQDSAEKEAETEKADTDPPKSIMDKPYGKEPEVEIKCEHKLGFLKTLPKDTAIPTECLSCPKIIECKHSYLARKPTEQNTSPEPITELVSFNAESEEETVET